MKVEIDGSPAREQKRDKLKINFVQNWPRKRENTCKKAELMKWRSNFSHLWNNLHKFRLWIEIWIPFWQLWRWQFVVDCCIFFDKVIRAQAILSHPVDEVPLLISFMVTLESWLRFSSPIENEFNRLKREMESGGNSELHAICFIRINQLDGWYICGMWAALLCSNH